MKRDMDLVRTVLLKVEAIPMVAGDVWSISWDDGFFDVPDHRRDDVIRHFQLLMDAGFIDSGGSQGMTDFVFRGLTWQGHEFLDTSRNPEVWSKTTAAAKKVGGVGFDLMVQIAKAEAKRFAAEKLGIVL